jgi:Choline/Carnitine o-acyltransferase
MLMSRTLTLTYSWMFDCARVPGTEGLDWSVSHAKDGDTSGDGHIVVLRNGHFWRLDAAKDGQILSTAELEAQVTSFFLRFFFFSHTSTMQPDRTYHFRIID